MRSLIAAVAAVCVVACAKSAPPKPRLQFDRFELVDTYGEQRPAEGNVFAIAHLTEDPRPEKMRELFGAVLVDWDGNKYPEIRATGNRGESGSQGLFGETVTLDPDRLAYIFEIPRTATPRSVTVPQEFEADVFRPVKPEERPKRVHGLDPHYPPGWDRSGFYRDWIKVNVFVTAEGRVGGVQLTDGIGAPLWRAREAVREWRYEPAHRNGEAVASVIEETVRFHPAPALGQYDVEPKAVHRVEPRFPAAAVRGRRSLDTTVQFEVVVDADGHVDTGRTVSGDYDLAKAAMDAVRQWRYEPALQNGKPVAATIPVIIRFQLDGSP